MLNDRPLQIEVLINSPGPHDEVRIRQPFAALHSLGVNCRIHERPFLFSRCIRPHSLVIWQRPLPDRWDRQMEHLQWLRERGCLLLTEWDDHPELFTAAIQHQLQRTQMAPLVGCHAIHSSNPALANALAPFNPITLVVENGVSSIPALRLEKHNSSELRLFIGNINRAEEHQDLVSELKSWATKTTQLTAVIVGDAQLASQLMPHMKVEQHPFLAYARYRQVLASCHIALLPLKKRRAQRCKTVIKWAEAAAESVAVVAGPELYNSVGHDASGDRTCAIGTNAITTMALTRQLATDRDARKKQVMAAHQWVGQEWSLDRLLGERLGAYRNLWVRRQQLDQRLLDRLGDRMPLLQQRSFAQ